MMQTKKLFSQCSVFLLGLLALVANAAPVAAQSVASAENFAASVSALGNAPATLAVNRPTTITANTIVPANVTLDFTNSGRLVVPNNVTVTIQGGINAVNNQHIFELKGTGKVDLYDSKTLDLYPEWWGAQINVQNDHAPAFQAMLDSLQRLNEPFTARTGGGSPRRVRLGTGGYFFNRALVIRAPVHIAGASSDYYTKGTVLYFTNLTGGLLITYNGTNQRPNDTILENFTLVGTQRDQQFRRENNGIQSFTTIHLRGIAARNFEGHGVSIEGIGDTRGMANSVRISDSAAYNNNGDGLYIFGNDANAGLIMNFNSSENRGWGIRDESFLGNTYIANHTRDNVSGSYSIGANQLLADNTLIGNYSEAGQPPAILGRASMSFGGTMYGGAGIRTGFFVHSQDPGVNSTTFKPFKVNKTNTSSSVNLFLGSDKQSYAVGKPENVVFGWSHPKDTDPTSPSHIFGYETADIPNWYSFHRTGGGASLSFQRNGDGVWLHNGFYLGDQYVRMFANPGTRNIIVEGTVHAAGQLVANEDIQARRNLVVTGTLTAGTKNFVIDHPLDPEHKKLVHAAVESPRNDLIYRGKIQFASGEKTKTVSIDRDSTMSDGTFQKLTKNAQVFVQNETGWSPCRAAVANGSVTIECREAEAQIVGWMVIAERNDDFIRSTEFVDENGSLVPEQKKTAGKN